MAGGADDRDLARRRRNFEAERELADRLRRAAPEHRRSLYPAVYEELFRRVEIPGYAEAQRAQVGLLLRLLEPFLGSGTRFLEIGAGSCDLSLVLAERLPRVWAVDAVPPQLPAGPAPGAFVFVRAERVRDEVPEAGVDLALSCHFVEHLHPDDLRGHLADVLALLAPGGRYVIVTPNRIYGPHDASRGFSDRASGLHLREWRHGDLARELRRAGFAEVRAVGRIGEAPRRIGLRAIALVEAVADTLPGSWRRAVLARAPRQAPFRPLEQVKLVAVKAGSSG
ncbi:MAG TPA: methyltransferase domain-containing protein [Methylomirabilota bacterium]|nr:methyltransferase domain-containing protein [Methylomirabilota bacterium]